MRYFFSVCLTWYFSSLKVSYFLELSEVGEEHGEGRARNSDELVCFNWIPFKKFIYSK